MTSGAGVAAAEGSSTATKPKAARRSNVVKETGQYGVGRVLHLADRGLLVEDEMLGEVGLLVGVGAELPQRFRHHLTAADAVQLHTNGCGARQSEPVPDLRGDVDQVEVDDLTEKREPQSVPGVATRHDE